jgi:hypothetical protein
MEDFYERLNKIEDRLKSRDFLNNSGLGNEIGFYIFDYPPERELEVRRHLDHLLDEINIKVARINLFELIIDYLKKENILEAAIEMQQSSGDEELGTAFKGVIEGARIAPLIIETARPDEHDVVVITGIGNTYPLLRAHDLLNNLQALMRNKPLVVFYPGKYTGQSLSLFGELKDENYYRAFRLVS